MYWYPADAEGEHLIEWAGLENPVMCTFEDLVANHSEYFYFEYENDELCLRNLVGSIEFTVDAQTASLIGGVHSPQRPK